MDSCGRMYIWEEKDYEENFQAIINVVEDANYDLKIQGRGRSKYIVYKNKETKVCGTNIKEA